MTDAETDDAFERAADLEYRLQKQRQDKQERVSEMPAYGSLAWARFTFHGKINALLFLLAALGVHWYIVQRLTYWMIAHGVIIFFTFLGVISAWGDQRVAEARLMERRARSGD